MLIKFFKDQKWTIDRKLVSFKKNEQKEISNLSIANDMIKHGYGEEVKDSKSNLNEKEISKETDSPNEEDKIIESNNIYEKDYEKQAFLNEDYGKKKKKNKNKEQ